jgi:predicted nuclease with TOPRIM domain
MEKILSIKKKLEDEIIEYDRKIERVRTLAAEGNSYKMRLLELSVEKFEIEKAKCDDRVAALEKENCALKEDIEKIKIFMEKINSNSN